MITCTVSHSTWDLAALGYIFIATQVKKYRSAMKTLFMSYSCESKKKSEGREHYQVGSPILSKVLPNPSRLILLLSY